MVNKDIVIKRLTIYTVLCFSLLLSPLANSVEVVAHKQLQVDSLTTSQLRRIYSMRQVVWPDGQAIVVFVLPSSHQLHRTFSKQVLKIFPYQLDRIWNKLIFSGVGKKPIVVDSQQALLEAVSSTPGAIGYVETLTTQDNVNVIEINQ